MIKRNKRNVGKRVRIVMPGHAFDGRTGKVVGFRGCQSTARDGGVIPYVQVFVDSLHAVYPFAGNQLKAVTP